MKIVSLPFLLLIVVGCNSSSSTIPKNDIREFNQYWNQGKAEITSYKLKQSISNTNYDGDVTLIYVTENFSKSKLIRLEEPEKHKSDLIKVMRCNMLSEFATGMNLHNVMTTVATPLDYAQAPHSLKVQCSIQDWDGQSFLSLLWKGHRYETYDVQYIESSPKLEKSFANTWLEDELWTKIRVAPDALPLGKIRMVPSAASLRMQNLALKIYDAEAVIVQEQENYSYQVVYKALNRKLEITFEKKFPHRITGWKEIQNDREISLATISKTIQSDYWNHQ
jgi:hypothetical protein